MIAITAGTFFPDRVLIFEIVICYSFDEKALLFTA